MQLVFLLGQLQLQIKQQTNKNNSKILGAFIGATMSLSTCDFPSFAFCHLQLIGSLELAFLKIRRHHLFQKLHPDRTRLNKRRGNIIFLFLSLEMRPYLSGFLSLLKFHLCRSCCSKLGYRPTLNHSWLRLTLWFEDRITFTGTENISKIVVLLVRRGGEAGVECTIKRTGSHID
jgi:hypothetical protein